MINNWIVDTVCPYHTVVNLELLTETYNIEDVSKKFSTVGKTLFSISKNDKVVLSPVFYSRRGISVNILSSIELLNTGFCREIIFDTENVYFVGVRKGKRFTRAMGARNISNFYDFAYYYNDLTRVPYIPSVETIKESNSVIGPLFRLIDTFPKKFVVLDSGETTTFIYDKKYIRNYKESVDKKVQTFNGFASPLGEGTASYLVFNKDSMHIITIPVMYIPTARDYREKAISMYDICDLGYNIDVTMNYMYVYNKEGIGMTALRVPPSNNYYLLAFPIPADIDMSDIVKVAEHVFPALPKGSWSTGKGYRNFIKNILWNMS